MGCVFIGTTDGRMVICGRNQREPECQYPDCHNARTFECDFPKRPGKTCNLAFCADHGRNVGYDQDHCWKHARHAAAQQRMLI